VRPLLDTPPPTRPGRTAPRRRPVRPRTAPPPAALSATTPGSPNNAAADSHPGHPSPPRSPAPPNNSTTASSPADEPPTVTQARPVARNPTQRIAPPGRSPTRATGRSTHARGIDRQNVNCPAVTVSPFSSWASRTGGFERGFAWLDGAGRQLPAAADAAERARLAPPWSSRPPTPQPSPTSWTPPPPTSRWPTPPAPTGMPIPSRSAVLQTGQK
jgi:hypothetical protein